MHAENAQLKKGIMRPLPRNRIFRIVQRVQHAIVLSPYDQGRTVSHHHAHSRNFLGHSHLSKMFNNQIDGVSAKPIKIKEYIWNRVVLARPLEARSSCTVG